MTTTIIRAVLFDLDGTLVDSAPDLCAAANRLRERENLPPLVYESLKNSAGKGARGLLWSALRLPFGSHRFLCLKKLLLADYEAHIYEKSALFNGISELLLELDARKIPWGIVTNKPYYLAQRVVAAALPLSKTLCLVGGDSTAKMKPAPDPILAGIKKLNVPAETVLYVGDDRRDIMAGQAAGTLTAAVSWGYADSINASRNWGATYVCDSPNEIVNLLRY